MKAALSLDLDNKWSYMKTHGDPEWISFPSYLDVVVPRVLETLTSLRLRITFFIVGQDATMPANREPISQIARAGHEIANHSFHHEPWMHRRPEAEMDGELARAEESIEAVTGQRPRGFRGPGFTQSAELLRTLVRRGYAYDASSLPTFIGPLARSYYFHTAKLSQQEMRDREDLFGSFSDGFRPNRQHRIETGEGPITEIPTTTFPGLRLPFHVSYVLYIATISPALALAYFRSALLFCKASGTEPSILLHPLDFLSASECPELSFFPAMLLDYGLKRTIVYAALTMLASRFEILPLTNVAKIEESEEAFVPG